MDEIKWRLTPLDDGGLMYLGLNITDGNQAALFFMRSDFQTGHVSEEDRAMMEAIIHLAGENYYDGHETEINEMIYKIIPWTRGLDTGLVRLIDRLTHMRMTNKQIVSLKLQLEMPL